MLLALPFAPRFLTLSFSIAVNFQAAPLILLPASVVYALTGSIDSFELISLHMRRLYLRGLGRTIPPLDLEQPIAVSNCYSCF